MDVNLHERRLDIEATKAAPIINTLATSEGVWPDAHWPPMVLDRGLSVGSKGGHGIIGYSVEEYVPGQRVRFRFSSPKGFDGWHELALIPADGACDLRHTLVVEPHGIARVSWPAVLRPLHDALIEDAFDAAQARVGASSPPSEWSLWVRLLRRAFAALRQLRHG